MTRSLLLVFALLSSACSGGTSATKTPSTQSGFNDAAALTKLEMELDKPIPEVWKESSLALVIDPVAMCNRSAVDAQVKNEASAQLEKTKNALQEAGITVQEVPENAGVVFSIRILANCTVGGTPLVTGDVSAMPGNGAVVAKSDLFDISRFDAGRVVLALLRNDALVARMQAK